MNKVMESFEAKEGDVELSARLLPLSDSDIRNLFYNVYGSYSGSTHEEWNNFKNRVERFLSRHERI